MEAVDDDVWTRLISFSDEKGKQTSTLSVLTPRS